MNTEPNESPSPPKDGFEISVRMWTYMEFEDIDLLIDQFRRVHSTARTGNRKLLRSLLSGCIILLTARYEAFIEDCFTWCLWYLDQSKGISKRLREYQGKSESFHNPTSKNIRKLYQSVGIQDIWQNWGLKKRTDEKFIKKLDELVRLRHRIAHGKVLCGDVRYPSTLRGVLQYTSMVKRFIPQFADQIRRLMPIEIKERY